MNRALSGLVVGCLATSVLSCRQNTEPQIVDRPPFTIPFPDSISRSSGLPPRAGDASTVVLPPDTLAIGQASATPAYLFLPIQVSARFFVRDTSSMGIRVRSIPLADCPFTLALSRGSDASIVWRSDRAATALRCPALHSNATGGTDVTATWDISPLLGDSIPSATYRMTLDVRAADGRVFHYGPFSGYLDRSTEPALRDYSVLQLTGSAEITGAAPRYLSTRVVARNTAAKPVEVDYGDCSVNVRLYTNAARTGAPVWKSELRKPPGAPTTYGCTLALRVSILPPGDSLVFPINVPIYEVIADSLPSGTYYASAEISLEGQRTPDGTFGPGLIKVMDAGKLDIVRERDRLPPSRIIDGLSYTATTRVIPGQGDDTLRTLVLLTNVSDHRIVTTVGWSCPITVLAYRDDVLRDSVPTTLPVVTLPPGCSSASYPFALEAGQSWVLGVDWPMSAIRGRFGTGHYWFSAWLFMSGSPVLAAGDAEVR